MAPLVFAVSVLMFSCTTRDLHPSCAGPSELSAGPAAAVR